VAAAGVVRRQLWGWRWAGRRRRLGAPRDVRSDSPVRHDRVVIVVVMMMMIGAFQRRFRALSLKCKNL